MWIIRMGKKINKVNKKRKKMIAGKKLSPVRRIERVSPLKDKKWVAMTFDDGPMQSPPNPWSGDAMGLTEVLLDALNKYDSKGTFDVIGTTESNYPDVKGDINTASWGGVKYDHYPNINEDNKAGVKNLPELTSRIIKEGHEITNHGYNHILFGPKKMIYGKREYFQNLNEVVEDLEKLHKMLEDDHNYSMTLSRPPHYIDNIKGGKDAYYAYQLMGYNYMAASFDGGGWLPTCGDYKKDVDKMVRPIVNKLKEDDDFFNGQIIFQKDGYNMSVQTPVADALPLQLEALKEAGYEVVTVSQLLEEMPFEDLDKDADYLEAVKYLNKKGYCIGYKNNTFQAERTATLEELCVMTTDPNTFKLSGLIKEYLRDGSKARSGSSIPDLSFLEYKTPYQIGIDHAKRKGYINAKLSTKEFTQELTYKVLAQFIENMDIKGKDLDGLFKTGTVKRKDLAIILEQVL